MCRSSKQINVVTFLLPSWIFVARKGGPAASNGIRIEAKRDESFAFASAVLALVDEHMAASDTLFVCVAEDDQKLVSKHFPNYFVNAKHGD